MIVDHASDFTTDKYRQLLREAKATWNFIPFSEYERPGKNILWRHDIDVSLERAQALAKIEAEEEIRSTFFVLLRGEYYNPLSPSSVKSLRTIAELGHELGLHFDPSFYGDKTKTNKKLFEYLTQEKKILEKLLNVNIKSFSWHNPTIGRWLSIKKNKYAGMINAYSSALCLHYKYVSDSNGFWRHERLNDILKKHEVAKLYVLTHPEWWVDTPIPPRMRIFRAVWGQAKVGIYRNDELLKHFSRENIHGHSLAIKFLQPIDSQLFELLDYLWNTGYYRTLFEEIWCLHQQQIKRLVTSTLYKKWGVSSKQVKNLFEKTEFSICEPRLFKAVTGISWYKASGTSKKRYNEALHLRMQLMKGWAPGKNELQLEQGIVFLCQIIQALAAWGKKQKIAYDGIGHFESVGITNSKNSENNRADLFKKRPKAMQDFPKSRWRELKTKIKQYQAWSSEH